MFRPLIVLAALAAAACTTVHSTPDGFVVASLGKAYVRHCTPSPEGERCVEVETANVSEQAAEPLAELLRALGVVLRALVPIGG
jgi:hypothetical protein